VDFEKFLKIFFVGLWEVWIGQEIIDEENWCDFEVGRERNCGKLQALAKSK
jgi:hypothetical protein